MLYLNLLLQILVMQYLRLKRCVLDIVPMIELMGCST
jgi:hypothetical protein